MWHKAARVALIAFCLCHGELPAYAGETVTYTYDALGRLKTSVTTGTVNNGVSTSVDYDAAGNRTIFAINGVTTPIVLSISNATVTEGGVATFAVSRTGPTAVAISATVTATSGTATLGTDFTAPLTTVTLAAGQTSAQISVNTTQDNIVESDEVFTLALSAPTAGATIGVATGTGTIVNDDASFAVSNAANVAEGGTLNFTITKTGAVTSSLTVNYATADGSAAAPGDYSATSGTLTFLPGETTKTVSVSTVDDALVEGAETVLLNLSGASGAATITTAQAAGTIDNNDASFAIGSASANEGGALVYTVTKTGAVGISLSVNYATANGTAIAPGDYTAASGTLTFLSNEVTKTISIATLSDALIEPNETMVVNLSSPTGGAVIGTGQGTGTIIDDTSLLSVSAVSAVSEGALLSFTISRTGATGTPATVNYATSDGTALAGSDYTATSGTLSFAAGDTTKTVSVSTIDDSVFLEGAETMSLALSAATGNASIQTVQAVGTIIDNDVAPTFSIVNLDTTLVEGADAKHRITLWPAQPLAYSVSYATANLSATAGLDYVAQIVTLTFQPGETIKDITVPTIDDNLGEAPETFSVNLSNATGGVGITTSQSISTISDNDSGAMNISIADATGYEGAGGFFTITRSGNTSGSIDVSVSFSSGTATLGADFTASGAIVHFNPGVTTQTVGMNILTDALVESDETYTANLTPVSAGLTLVRGQAVGTIKDSNSGPPQFRVNSTPLYAFEGVDPYMTFTVTKEGGATTGTYTINYASSEGKPPLDTNGAIATSGADYTPVNGTLTFGPNETTKTILVPITTDNINEPNLEWLRMDLSNASADGMVTGGTAFGYIADTPPS
jgi:Calx-beta domain